MILGRYLTEKRLMPIGATLLFTSYITSTYGFGIYLFPAMIEPVKSDLGFSYAAYGTVAAIVQAGAMISALFSGFLAVWFGSRVVVLTSITISALCLLGMGFTHSLATSAVLLTILSICSSTVWIPIVGLSGVAIPSKHRGKALGLISSGTSYGVFLNSMLLLFLLPLTGWRSVWVLAGIFVSIIAITSFFWLPKIDHRPEDVRNDNTQKVNTSVIQQLKSLPRKHTSLLLIAMFLSGIAYRPFQIYLSPYAETNLTSAEEVSAYSWMIIGAVGMVSGLTVGYLADKVSIRRGIMFVCTLMSLSCSFIIFGAEHDASLFFYLSSLLFGASFYPIFGLFPAYISRCYSQKSAALAFSFGNFALGAGGVIGNFAGGMTVDITGSFTPAYLIMLISVVLSAVVVTLFPKENTHD